MANLSRTRTLFAFISPRTIEKIIPEIEVLTDFFSGEQWNSNTQADFFKRLFASEFYEGNAMPSDITLAARDRITRAPKALGFVDLKPNIRLTEVGKKLLSGVRINETIAKQLLKFQIPSPYHKTPVDRNFNVKPYLELLRLTKTVNNLSKTEIAIFFIQLTHYKLFDEVVKSILDFRAAISKQKGNRKKFIDDFFDKQILKIYAEEIDANDIKTRESNNTSLKYFLKTKKRNHLDYADAFTRYLRATEYVSFDKKTFRMIISPSRMEEVDFVLKSIDREVGEFASDSDYKKFLFNSDTLSLLTDSKEYIFKKLSKLSISFDSGASIDILKNLLDKTEIEIVSNIVENTERSLKHYREFDDIIDVFGKIQGREVPDPPLYLEWNIWRSMVMMNYAKTIKGNFRFDLDGMPLNTALGNLPDIEVEYETFRLIIEVTMSSGNKQYEMEGEPVARHFGNIQRNTDKPVYCLFVAPKISEGSLAHFFNLNRMNTKAYGGKTRIIPMSLDSFILFLTVAKTKQFKNPQNLKAYFDKLIDNNLVADDEVIWFHQASEFVKDWVIN